MASIFNYIYSIPSSSMYVSFAPKSNILQSICNYDGLHVIGNIKIGEVNYNFKFLEKIAYVHLPIAMFDSYL